MDRILHIEQTWTSPWLHSGMLDCALNSFKSPNQLLKTVHLASDYHLWEGTWRSLNKMYHLRARGTPLLWWLLKSGEEVSTISKISLQSRSFYCLLWLCVYTGTLQWINEYCPRHFIYHCPLLKHWTVVELHRNLFSLLCNSTPTRQRTEQWYWWPKETCLLTQHNHSHPP